jgi:enamine deaminase RidA (YjgF/YER057c/UK114 family)
VAEARTCAVHLNRLGPADEEKAAKCQKIAYRTWFACFAPQHEGGKLVQMYLAERLANLKIELPRLAGPFGAYVPARRVGNLIYVSGQLPMKEGKLMVTGPVPSRCSIEQAQQAARQCVINALSAVQTLDPAGIEQLDGVVRVGAFINSDTGFIEQPRVANGASDLLLELFGDAGRHARAAVGVNTLPLDASVEVEFIFLGR